MRTRCGLPTGSVVVLTRQPFPQDALSVFPQGVSATLLDRHDVTMFVERSERLLTLSDDLRWLAQPEHFDRLITITEIPSTYGRRELRDVLNRYANVHVAPTDIVFQFDAFGEQTDLAWVVCQTIKDSTRVLHRIQELPVPQRVQYASLFGCAFLWAHRSSVFITHREIDFKIHRRKSHVFLSGWEAFTTTEDFEALLTQLNLVPPTMTQRVYNPVTQVTSFFLEFDNMKDARQALVQFHNLKREWKLPEATLLFAFPRMADVRWLDKTNPYQKPPDQDQEGDSDIEDPIEG